ncbi:phage portal protein [Nonomuraea glycinis]|uniref:phage portal protein n=1 Tax=Nonomuraea glycinis TaxID=2047744 RepID=UPI0033B6570D
MAFLPSLRSTSAPPTEKKSWSVDYDDGSGWSGMLARLRDPRRSWPVERAVVEGLERVVWVFKSVSTIAGRASELPIERVLIKEDGEREVIADDPLARLLNVGRVNELEWGPQLRKRLSGQVLLSPNGAFVEVTTNRRGHPTGLDLLPPGRTRPVPGRGGSLLSHFETIGPDGLRHAIDPERVLWFRDPHTLDPYRAITPMDAAGLSVDLDFLARLYNATFLRNDGRPGGVIGIDGEVDDDEMRRIQSVFGRGAHEAGKLTVLQGDLSWIDLAAKPRDMAYTDLARIAKEEILAAFGVPESVLGNASGRTFDNASQEEENFWRFTMLPHLSLLVTGWDTDHDDDAVYEYNTDSVEVLQRAKALRRQEAREEFAAGLISPDEYRSIAGYDPIEMPHSRALYIAQGKTPIPTKEEDAVALGIAPPDTGEPAAGELPPGDVPGELPAGEGSGGELPGVEPQPELPAGAVRPGEGQALARLREMLDQRRREDVDDEPDQPDQSGEPAEPEPADEDDEDDEDDEPEDGRRGRQTKASLGTGSGPVAAALAQLGGRFVARTVARLESPKHRKGTRHFIAEFKVDTRVGDSPLDGSRIVPDATWQAEAEQAVLPPLLAAAMAGGADAMDAHGQAVLAAEMVGEEFGRVAAAVRAGVEGLDQGGAAIGEMVAAVQDLDLAGWVDSAADRARTLMDTIKEER